VVNLPNPQTNIVVSLADFVANGVSTYEAFKRALDSCRQRRAAKLIIPTGRYVFDDPKILQPDVNVHIGLYSLSDLTIDGQGSEFVFHHPRIGFGFAGNQRLLVRNITVDWDITLASPGIARKEPNGQTSIRLSDGYPANENTVFAAVNSYDIRSRRWVKGGAEVYNPRNVTMIAPQSFVSPDFNQFRDGEEVIVRHYTYGYEAFNVNQGNSDITLENITVYSCPGMGFGFFSAERGFRLSGCRIMQKPGAQRLISATADGAHFSRTLGDIIVEDCDFSGQGDDSLNINGLYLPITSKVNARTVILNAASFHIIRPGDELKFVKSGNLAEYARYKATQISPGPDNTSQMVTVDSDLSSNLAAGDLVINLQRTSPRFLVRRNFFHDHRARGMLIQSRDGLVENNRVKDVTMAGMHLTTDSHFFFEGPGCENVTIRGNTFEGCNYNRIGTVGPGSRHMGCLNVTSDVLSGISDYPVHNNVLIEGNTIINTIGLAVLIASSDGVIVRNNIINGSNMESYDVIRSGAAIDATAMRSIMVTRTANVTVAGNRQVISLSQYDKGVYVDPRNTSNVTAQDNSEVNYPAHVSAASFNGARLAAESITAAFGPGLATRLESATTTPLPTSLGGTTVKVKDFAGDERLAPLFFVAPGQVNYQIPPEAAVGPAVITITASDGTTSIGVTRIENVAPGLFSANSNGQGVAASVALRVKSDRRQNYEPVAIYDAAQNKFVSLPVDLGPADDQVFLLLYGTGLRRRSGLSAVSARVGGVATAVPFAGAAPGFVGLDQTNILLPRSLAGRGEVDITLTVDGRTSNVVKLAIK
jgi:uncharacterized protein (TIGR03437 family)